MSSPEGKKMKDQPKIPTEEAAKLLIQDACVKLTRDESLPILRSRKEIEDDCEKIQYLGKGIFATLVLVRYHGMLAVKKIPHDHVQSTTNDTVNEGMILYQLKGAGSAPRLLGLSLDSPAIIMSYRVGCSLFSFIPGPRVINRTSWWLKALLSVVRNVMEIHELGCIHNDLHQHNILLSVIEEENTPVTRLIDFGASEMMDQELLDGELAFGLRDIRALGFLFEKVAKRRMNTAGQDEVWKEGLQTLVEAMKNENDRKVPHLSQVYKKLRHLLSCTTTTRRTLKQEYTPRHQSPNTPTESNLPSNHFLTGLRFIAKLMGFMNEK